jgi:uracil-DNA glycosylase
VATSPPSSPTAPDAPVRTLRELERAVQSCTACELHAGRITPVVGQGTDAARVMLVGSVPRRHEDLQGKPFAGATGNVLDNLLGEVGLAPEECYRTTVVKCRPADDEPAPLASVEACAIHLDAQIRLVEPEVIVSLGAFTTSVLLRRQVPIERVAGYRLDIRSGITLIPTYHPVDVVRGVPQAAAAMRRDLAAARAVLDGRLSTGAEALAELRARKTKTTT